MKAFLNAVSFLTIFKTGKKFFLDEKKFHTSLYFFPLVGLIIGMIISLVYFLTGLIFPSFLCMISVIFIEVFISGAMHLDGLGDTFDGVFSGGNDTQKIIGIMKKSDIGVFGVVSLILLFILKISFLLSIFMVVKGNDVYTFGVSDDISNPSNLSRNIIGYLRTLPSYDMKLLINFIFVLLFMPSFSRWTINFHFLKFKKYSSPESLTAIFLKSDTTKSFKVASIYLFLSYVLFNSIAGFYLKNDFIFNSYSWILNNGILIMRDSYLFVLIPLMKSIIIIILIILFTNLIGKFFIKRTGRLSGDSVGAVVEITEIIYLFLVYIFIFVF